MPVASAERQGHHSKLGDWFVKRFDRGLGREMTEEALRDMIHRTLGGQIPYAVKNSNYTPRDFYRRSAIFEKLLEQRIVRVGPSHVAKKDSSDGFSLHIKRSAKDPYIELNLNPFSTFKASEPSHPLPEDNLLTELFQSGERKAELILANSIITTTTFYQNVHRRLAIINKSVTT